MELNNENDMSTNVKKSMDSKTANIISYLSIIGWLIAYYQCDKEPCRFHLNQSLVLNIASIVLSMLSRFGRPISYIVWVAQMVLGVLWLIGFLAAIRNEEKKIPLLGEIQLLK